MFVVDTNVVSVRGKWPSLANWMDANSPRLYLSTMTVAEITDGIFKVRRTGAKQMADDLSKWLENLIKLYSGSILDFDTECAQVAGGLSDTARRQGLAPGWADIIIAGAAQRHGMTVLTRNVRHFAPLGVKVIDPLVALP